MLLTDEQIHEIKKIIEEYHSAFVANVISPKAVPPELLQKLKDKGLVDVHVGSIEESYLYGQVVAAMNDPKAAKMTYEQFKEHLRTKPIPLSQPEVRAIEMAQHRAAQYAVGLANKITTSTTKEADTLDQTLIAQQIREEIQTATAENIAKRESVRKLKSDLGWKRKDWARDWDRIAVTEKNNAMQTAVANTYSKDYGKDVRVFKRVMPDACPHCVKAYLVPGTQRPKVFKLSELEANGSNFGKKAAQWLPVVESMHPNCFIPGTKILTEFGEQPIEEVLPGTLVLSHDGNWHPVTHVWASTYEGDVIKLDTKFGSVTATADHPFYTESGWCLAKQLVENKNLLGFFSDRHRNLLAHLDSKKGPTKLFQDSLFASILFGFSRTGVPVTAIDFNGEFYVREGEVNQTIFQEVVREGIQTNSSERIIDPAFIGRFELTRVSFEDSVDETLGLLFPFEGGMESGNVSQPFFWRHFGHTNSLSLAPIPLCASCSSNSVDNSPPRNFESFGYLFYRHQIVEVHTKDFVNIEFNPARSSFHTGETPNPYPIVNTKTSYYRGIVVNLTVSESNSFVADGHIVHNCQCQTVRMPVGWGFDEDGELLPDGEFREEYGEGEELKKSIQEEADLVKAFKLQGHVTFQGIPVAIENKIGTTRKWKDADGNDGETKMLFAYGYVKRTTGTDTDEIDVYVGPNPKAQNVFIVDQQNPESGIYDEQKVMLGFSDEKQALWAYEAHMDRNDFQVNVSPMPLEQFKRWYAGTEEQVGLKGKTVVKHVIPLKKSLAPEMGALSSQIPNRAPGPNTGANYFINMPKRRTPEPITDEKMKPSPDLLMRETQPAREAMKRDKEVYHVVESTRKAIKKDVRTAYKNAGKAVDEEEAEERKKRLKAEGLKAIIGTKIYAEVG